MRIPIKPWFRFGESLCVWVWRLDVRRGHLLLSWIRVTLLCSLGNDQSVVRALIISTCRVTNHTARQTIWGWSAHTCLAPSFPLGKWQKQIATCLFACRCEPPENAEFGTVRERSSNVLQLWVVDISQNRYINYLKQFWCCLISTLPSKPIMIPKSLSHPDRGNVLKAKGVNICIVPLVCRQRVNSAYSLIGILGKAKHTLNAYVLLPHSGCVYKTFTIPTTKAMVNTSNRSSFSIRL